jgi:hypothetical protein
MGSEAIKPITIVERVSVELELIRPELNAIGADILTINGQTIFPFINSIGNFVGWMIYVGPLNARKDLEFNWDRVFLYEKRENFDGLIPCIRRRAKEMAWLQ